MASLRRPNGPTASDTSTKFLYTILKQLDLKHVDWNEVAITLDISNGHAARMRYSRLKGQLEGIMMPPRSRARKKDGACGGGGGGARKDDGFGMATGLGTSMAKSKLGVKRGLDAEKGIGGKACTGVNKKSKMMNPYYRNEHKHDEDDGGDDGGESYLNMGFGNGIDGGGGGSGGGFPKLSNIMRDGPPVNACGRRPVVAGAAGAAAAAARAASITTAPFDIKPDPDLAHRARSTMFQQPQRLDVAAGTDGRYWSHSIPTTLQTPIKTTLPGQRSLGSMELKTIPDPRTTFHNSMFSRNQSFASQGNTKAPSGCGDNGTSDNNNHHYHSHSGIENVNHSNSNMHESRFQVPFYHRSARPPLAPPQPFQRHWFQPLGQQGASTEGKYLSNTTHRPSPGSLATQYQFVPMDQQQKQQRQMQVQHSYTRPDPALHQPLPGMDWPRSPQVISSVQPTFMPLNQNLDMSAIDCGPQPKNAASNHNQSDHEQKLKVADLEQQLPFQGEQSRSTQRYEPGSVNTEPFTDGTREQGKISAVSTIKPQRLAKVPIIKAEPELDCPSGTEGQPTISTTAMSSAGVITEADAGLADCPSEPCPEDLLHQVLSTSLDQDLIASLQEILPKSVSDVSVIHAGADKVGEKRSSQAPQVYPVAASTSHESQVGDSCCEIIHVEHSEKGDSTDTTGSTNGGRSLTMRVNDWTSPGPVPTLNGSPVVDVYPFLSAPKRTATDSLNEVGMQSQRDIGTCAPGHNYCCKSLDMAPEESAFRYTVETPTSATKIVSRSTPSNFGSTSHGLDRDDAIVVKQEAMPMPITAIRSFREGNLGLL